MAVAVLAASTGGPGSPRPAPAARGGGARSPVLLTAAMVHQVANASRAALALSGRTTIGSTSTRNGVPGDSSTDVITFSGENWNDVISQTSPGAADHRAGPRDRHLRPGLSY